MRPCGWRCLPSPVEPSFSRYEQRVIHRAARDAVLVLEQDSGLLEDALLLLASRPRPGCFRVAGVWRSGSSVTKQAVVGRRTRRGPLNDRRVRFSIIRLD